MTTSEITCLTSSFADPRPALALVPDTSTAVEELGGQIVALAGRLAAATCRWLLLVADFDARAGYERWVLGSTAAWLAYSCGLSRRTAVDHVRVARTLAAHPALAEEMSAGRLSYSHVRAISRVVREDDETLVGDLIEVGEYGTVAHLESVVRGLRTVEGIEARERGAEPVERVRSSWTAIGQWRHSARLAPERGAIIDAALDKVMAIEDLSREDAFVRIAEIALAALNDKAEPVRALRGEERAAIVILLDARQVRRARSAERVPRTRPVARIAGGPPLPDSVVRRLACAGRIRSVISTHENGREQVLDVGRSHRIVTDRQYRALLIRDSGCCTYPGCATTRGLEAHHVTHWLDGGPTNLANLLLLCVRHHHAHHDDEFTIRPAPAGFAFCLPDGTLLPAHVDLSTRSATAAPIETEHANIEPAAATTRWKGEHLDLHYAVSCLTERRIQAQSVGKPREHRL